MVIGGIVTLLFSVFVLFFAVVIGIGALLYGKGPRKALFATAPPEGKVAKEISLLDHQIILAEPLKGTLPKKGHRNVLAIDANGKVVWHAELPADKPNQYVGIWADNDKLFGRDSNDQVVQLDPYTGAYAGIVEPEHK